MQRTIGAILFTFLVCLFFPNPAGASTDHLMIVYMSSKGDISEIQLYFFTANNNFRTRPDFTNYDYYTTVGLNGGGELEYIDLKIPWGLFSVDIAGNLSIVELEMTTKLEYRNGQLYSLCSTALDRRRCKKYTRVVYYKTKNFKEGKIRELGKIDFDYHNTHDFRRGLLSKIGKLKFRFFTNQDFRQGKLSKVGMSIEYYTGQDYRRGKLYKIGNVNFSYYQTGKIAKIGDIEMVYDKSGELIEIDGEAGPKLIIEVER